MTPQSLALSTPATPSRTARFWDRVADRYAKKPVGDEAAYRHKLARTQSYLRPDMAVLEIGCGTGSVALEHAPHVRHIQATDVSGRMIAIAREKAAAAGVTNIRFEQAGVDQVVAEPGSLDAVFAMNILHLL
ncbi:MAG: methyltransferase domain-containing protein, partial [Pseudomonadota bacterium]